jgi:hypothetical protein
LYILDTSPLLFSPKVFDTNTKTFRLEIDRDVFVGHPIHIREEDKKKAKQSKKTKKKKRKMTEAIPELHASYSATTSIDKKNVANVSLFNVVFALRYAKDSDKEMNNTYTISDMSKCAEYVMFECEARECQPYHSNAHPNTKLKLKHQQVHIDGVSIDVRALRATMSTLRKGEKDKLSLPPRLRVVYCSFVTKDQDSEKPVRVVCSVLENFNHFIFQ